ncbi:MAG TPA: DUF3370 domain-containing protein [Leptolyngbyaceae cyanobacterium]
MLPFLPIISLLQATPAPTPAPPQEILRQQEVRPLPGQLNNIPVFNSNSPELVLKEGILLSTFPPIGKRFPTAHLNFPFRGRFDLFAHHVARGESPDNLQTLYLGVIIHNPTLKPVKVEILQGASYLSQPDAPFIDFPSGRDNSDGTVYAGPGDRVMSDLLRGKGQGNFPTQLVIAPGQSEMLLNLPIPVRTLTPPLNGRSTLMQLQSDGTVYMASLGMFARINEDGSERPPNLAEWQKLLTEGDVSGPRDRTPTPPDRTSGGIIYGRVSGVARGNEWQARLVDRASANNLTIPSPGQAFSYPLSTIPRGTMGTGQVQSATMLVRYPDTAYQAHGNYGIRYNLSLPLINPTRETQNVVVAVETAVKEDKLQGGLRFLPSSGQPVFFRGTVRIRYEDDRKLTQTRYVHLYHRRGQEGEPLVTLKMPPGDRRLVQVDFLYPPDASPPQVLTVKTIK